MYGEQLFVQLYIIIPIKPGTSLFLSKLGPTTGSIEAMHNPLRETCLRLHRLV